VTAAEVVAAYLGAFASSDPDQVAQWVTEDFVNEHTAVLGGGCTGRDEYRRRLPGFLGSFVDLVYEVEEIVAEGSAATAAYTMCAKWQGTDPIEIRGVQRFTIRDGLVAKRTDYWDSLQFLLQVDPTVRDQLSKWLA
jgi:ketosteroid isomerase-like protein